MNYSFRFFVFGLLTMTGLTAAAIAQSPASPAPARPAAARSAPAATAPANAAGYTAPNAPFRKLAPDVMQDVDASRHADEAFETHGVTELLAIDPNFEFAKDIPFRHQVWMLEIKYKPVRMIMADVPGNDGRMLRKQIWYIVYQVTNPGKAYQPVEKDDPLNKLDVSGKLYTLETVDKPRRFSPVFTLETHTLIKEDTGFSKAAVEQYIPIVLPAIRAREDKNREFLTSVQMAEKQIAVGETVWGVATWQDVDPNNVWFSVYVEGLTNAYKWTDDPAKYAAHKKWMDAGGATSGPQPPPFREISTKVLKLNFWRPGDEFTIRENQVRNGVPELPGGPKARPASEWVWWRSFPLSKGAVPEK